MTKTIRVSLWNYNALTETDIDKYALYADTDNVLIKEKARGTMNIAHFTTGTISHNLGHIPYYMVYTNIGGDTYKVSNSFNPFSGGWRVYCDTANVIIDNNFGTAGTVVQYYIFYDNVGG